MKCCDITSGKLNTLITIERNTPSPDGEGGFTESWAADPVGGVWAWVRAVGGSERWMAERVAPGNRYRIVIRFRGDGNGAPYYGIGDRMQINGRELGITSVVDVEGESRYLEIMAMENAPS